MPHSAEQPGAIQSDVSTAPLKQSKPQETEVTSITTPRPPTSISACTSITPALPISGDPTEASESKENKPISSGSTEASESRENKPVSSGSTEASGSNDDNSSKQEQRSTSQAEGGGGESSEAPRQEHHHDVSKEALKGPQGPAPRAAEDFEKDYRGKNTSAKSEHIEKSMFPFFCSPFPSYIFDGIGFGRC